MRGKAEETAAIVILYGERQSLLGKPAVVVIHDIPSAQFAGHVEGESLTVQLDLGDRKLVIRSHQHAGQSGVGHGEAQLDFLGAANGIRRAPRPPSRDRVFARRGKRTRRDNSSEYKSPD